MNREVNAVEHPAIQSFPTAVLAKCFVLALAVCTLLAIPGSLVFAQAVVDGGLTATEIGWSLGRQSAGERRLLAGHGGMDASEQLFQSRSDHAGTQRCGQPSDERFGDLQQFDSGRRELAQSHERAGVHAERRAQDRRCCRRQLHRRRDVRSARLCAFTDHQRHHRLDQHTLQHITVPAGAKTLVRLQTYGPVTSGSAWFANLSIAAGDPAGAADVPAVPELSRHDVLRSEPGRQRRSDRHSARGNFTVESASGTQRDRLRWQYRRQPDNHSHLD